MLGLLIFRNCGPPTADRFFTPLTVLHTCIYAPTSNMTTGWASLCLKSEEKMGSHTHHQHFVCCGIQRYVQNLKPELNFFKHPQFTGFQHTLDAEMKWLRSTGLGVKKHNKAEPISVADENSLEIKVSGWPFPTRSCLTLWYFTPGFILLCTVGKSIDIFSYHRLSYSSQRERVHT